MTMRLVKAAEVIDPAEPAPPPPDSGGVRLNLGCNQRPRLGYVNVDIENFPGVDVVTDLERRWPWDDGSVDEVACADLPEHLRVWYDTYDTDGCETLEQLKAALAKPVRHYGIIHFFNEAWRVLRSGGLLDVLVPSTDVAGRGAWQDPTHVSWWNENTLLYFCDMPGNFRGLYPSLIRANFRVRQCRTFMPNPQGVTYLQFTLEKP